MNVKEYRKRCLELRRIINIFMDDMGATCDNSPALLDKLLNDSLNGDIETLDPKKEGNTRKILDVDNYRSMEHWNTPRYI